jgi:hypothetical protein
MTLSRRAALVLAPFAVVAGALAQHSPVLESKFPDPSLTGPPITWVTDLSADEMSWTVDSPGRGRAEFVLERKTMKLSWRVTYEKLTSAATRVAIHGPQTPGGEAGVLIDLGEKGLASPVTGESVINDGMLRYLVTDRFYIAIATQKNKGGEIRGQLQRVSPAASH